MKCKDYILTNYSARCLMHFAVQLLLFTVVLLFIIPTANAQSKELKLIERGKYAKAEKKIKKALKKDPKDIGQNYAMTLLLINEIYKKYSPVDAYEYVNYAIRDYAGLSFDNKELKNLEKLSITKNILSELSDSVCFKAMNKVLQDQSIEACNQYVNVFKTAPQKYIDRVILMRNELAYKSARSLNNVESYQKFIDNYPNSVQLDEAIKRRNACAYDQALIVNTIEAFNSFIEKYPHASQIKQATEKVSLLKFESTRKKNTIKAYEQYLEEYPNSEFFNEAFQSLEKLQYTENTKPGNWKSYKSFIEQYPYNVWKNKALDAIFSIALERNSKDALQYCTNKLTGKKREEVLLKLLEYYSQDGEKSSLNLFFEKYGRNLIPSVIDEVYHEADMGEELYLHLKYKESESGRYSDYIKTFAPSELSFVALQRMISHDIANKKWGSAVATINQFLQYFGESNKKLLDLISILERPYDNSIKVNSVGNGINTKNGKEYMPVLTADESLLYFCGRDRSDNIGGEDIFVSENKNGNWDKAQLLSDLSLPVSNEAPLNISVDGNRMLLFQEGMLFFSDKISTGWAEPQMFPYNINKASWQSDAMITGDGQGLLFASTMEGGYNIHTEQKIYHGDNLYPTDLYISLLDENNEWGEAINLGSVINTAYSERMPYLHPDMKTLYFSSDGHGGLGKMDVFKTTRLSDSCWNCWSEPVNLGKEINTVESDAGYKINTSGDKAYFTFSDNSNAQTSIVFLIDISGSMRGYKLESLKKATIDACETALQNNAEIAIMAFSGNCKSPISEGLKFTRDFRKIEAYVNSLYANGGTPMYEAYLYSCNYMKFQSSKNSTDKVILLMTDGDDNGCSTLDAIQRNIKSNNYLFRTQTIAYDVSSRSKAYSDLQQIASFSGGKFYPSMGTDNLGATFEAASKDIFNISKAGNNRDIKWIELPLYLRPGLVATISGKINDIEGKPVSAQIRWEDLETGIEIGQSSTDPVDGSYFITLPLGKMYGYFINKENYYPISNNIDLREGDKPVNIEKDIEIVTFEQMINKNITVSVNNLFFDFAKSTLLPMSIPELKRVASIIIDNNLKVELSGHTDNVGNDKQNQVLSEDRANTVKQFLINQGCSPGELTAIGYGESKPVASNDSDEGRAKNRRVEIKLIK
ncbi:MAG: OmpA family protein [Prolixibacteraceae bacterium]|jgi:outer membrane protein OmpA-like peptidoglycan-associated protein/uncharacterized protein YegL/outer membrane protein assembly factor BamD (BamD/ComL family)|nr:OmpA family protein [Prolixibacteraceae bacterium]